MKHPSQIYLILTRCQREEMVHVSIDIYLNHLFLTFSKTIKIPSIMLVEGVVRLGTLLIHTTYHHS
jgi:hypothetical protein